MLLKIDYESCFMSFIVKWIESFYFTDERFLGLLVMQDFLQTSNKASLNFVRDGHLSTCVETVFGFITNCVTLLCLIVWGWGLRGGGQIANFGKKNLKYSIINHYKRMS